MEIAPEFQVRNNDILKLHKMKQKVRFNEEFANMYVWCNWSNSFTSNKLHHTVTGGPKFSSNRRILVQLMSSQPFEASIALQIFNHTQ
ncbi:hypothetical protein P5673_022390 [Acropora cervicornis]|uniref:Uncharacterized protein n=1 Tax=Acropora cervicornis TaxID=6130 RepID=A0AAD9Q705_ACRCE|nr:hypothetical protein P5673_022390 [Acropora cervicornis]